MSIIGGESHFGYIPPENILPNTGCGTDYCLNYSDELVSIWTDGYNDWRGDVFYNGLIDCFVYWKPLFHTARMGFVFASASIEPAGQHGCSVYDKNKFWAVMDLMQERGVKCIAMYQNNYDSQNFVGSPEMTADWLQLVRDLKDHPNLKGVSFFSEPTAKFDEWGGTDNGIGVYNTWHSSIATDGTPKDEGNQNLANYFSWLTREVHKIAPHLIVYYPFLSLTEYDTNKVIQFIRNTGIFDEPNVIFDIAHPYYFENHTEWGDMYIPTHQHAIDQANLHKSHSFNPWIQAIGAGKCYIGETFMFWRACYETNYIEPAENGAIQQTFWKALVNHMVDLKIGFQMWGLINSLPLTTNNTLHTETLDSSNYGKLSVDGIPDTTHNITINTRLI